MAGGKAGGFRQEICKFGRKIDYWEVPLLSCVEKGCLKTAGGRQKFLHHLMLGKQLLEGKRCLASMPKAGYGKWQGEGRKVLVAVQGYGMARYGNVSPLLLRGGPEIGVDGEKLPRPSALCPPSCPLSLLPPLLFSSLSPALHRHACWR